MPVTRHPAQSVSVTIPECLEIFILQILMINTEYTETFTAKVIVSNILIITLTDRTC